MLKLLICSDVHTFTDNIRLALKKVRRADAILIAGDVEAEKDGILAAAGNVPLYIVCGNCDYYLNTDYPEELLFDICLKQPALYSQDHMEQEDLDPLPPDQNSPAGPVIGRVTELRYSTLPEKAFSLHPLIKKSLPAFLTGKLIREKRPAGVLHRILMTHGKEYHVPDTDLLSRRAELWDADIVIFGHTHRFAETTRKQGRRHFINPGCLIGDPKDPPTVLAGCEICCFALLEIGPEGEIHVQKLTL